MIVAETETMRSVPTWDLSRCRSSRIVGIRGASPNQPKKQTNNMSHAR
jgi:hypothetical protein